LPIDRSLVKHRIDQDSNQIASSNPGLSQRIVWSR
jgi:hypothetical protein